MVGHDLFDAIEANDAKGLDAAIRQGAKLNSAIPVYGTPLGFAIVSDRIEMVERLLNKGADPNGSDGKVDPPLHTAILQRNQDIARLLIKRGADPNLKNANGSTPLHVTALIDSLPLAKLLVEAGADPLAKDKHKNSPLAAAELSGNRKLVSLLKTASANRGEESLTLVDAARLGRTNRVAQLMPLAKSGECRSALAAAVAEGQVECVRTLLSTSGTKQQVPIGDFEGSGEWPLLFHAVRARQPEIVQLLLDQGADPNEVCSEDHTRGQTPLMMAAATGDAKLVALFLAHGANWRLRDHKGQSALDLARASGLKRVVQLLEPVFKSTSNSMTLLEAVRSGHAERVRQLAAQGADLDELDGRGRSLLMIAIEAGHAECAAELLRRTPGITSGSTIEPELWRHALGIHASAELVQTLLDAGLDPNAQMDSHGLKPLIFAAGFGGSNVAKVIEVLLAAGADPQARYQCELPMTPRRRMLRESEHSEGNEIPSLNALEFAKRMSNRRAYKYLHDRLAIPPDLYDTTLAEWQERREPTKEFSSLAKELAAGLKGRALAWKRRAGVFYISVRPAHLEENLDALRKQALNKGALLIEHIQAASSGDRAGLLLFPTTDPLAILIACGTNGANYGLSTRQVVEWFDEIRRAWPFTMMGCGFDFADIQFQLPIRNRSSLERKVKAFCPDSTDGDEIISTEGRCYFWWD